MKNRAEELKKEMNEFIDECMKVGGVNFIETMDATTLSIVQRTFKMFRLSEEIMVEQAEILDDMNSKLDKLIYYVKELGKDK